MASFLDLPADTGFGLHNLPYGAFSTDGGPPRVGARLGEWVIDMAELERRGRLSIPGAEGRQGGEGVFDRPTLNRFMSLGTAAWSAVREQLQTLFADGAGSLKDQEGLTGAVLVPLDAVTMHLPATLGDYTDFYSSRQHATNVGVMFRGVENALMPNWLHLPVGYHGRASSVVISGTPVRRPSGQTNADDGAQPSFGPSRLLDFELELGFFVGPETTLGEPIPMDRAAEHIFGFVLVNDWSARDIQKWEYVPLGPFLGKNFATSISPWVVPYAALEPFRVAGEVQSGENPEPLPYLRQPEPRSLDIGLEVALQTGAMREAGLPAETISRSNARNLYWSPEQQLVHHTVNGCNVRPGDLLASGTISGASPGEYGSMLELSWRGTRPVQLATGETRSFLADGDRLVLRGEARVGGRRVGFGSVEGEVLSAGASSG